MNTIFADRLIDVPRSFIREILKVTLDPTVISFAGGLPNRDFFPIDQLKEATEAVFDIYGKDVFQYSSSEGLPELRQYIADTYQKENNLTVSPDNILITSGSQQGLDIIGKTFLNRGDGLLIEEPGYLGAIQAFSIYKPNFLPVPVNNDGMDSSKFEAVFTAEKPKLIYTVPNFQNPTGISYSEENRVSMANVVKGTNAILIEDDPYGSLRYKGQKKSPFKRLLPDNTILLGSFSKTVVPGFRIGWLVAPDHIMQKIIIAKQATDLHTSHFTQSIIYQFLANCNVETHIDRIRQAYGKQCSAMQEAISAYFPSSVTCTSPEGGMFLWAELAENMSALELFDIAANDKVVFVPGDPFYVNRKDTNTMRLNFSCVSEETIQTGIQRLGKAIEKISS